ncbi:MAG: non-heme iron oxygenase ferredoxin subunit [Actinomycetota bacterium]|nr:non-heme iron oxygenase ferredoxin subunit [Actinomycetota bacterium]
MKPLRRLTDGIERWRGLDRVGAPTNRLALKTIRNGPVKDLLSGTWLVHPVHPMLVAVPIGSWIGASVLDAMPGYNAAAARRLVGLGVLAALPTAATGLSDWSDTAGAEQRVGVVHAALNLTATAIYAGSWWCRRTSTTGGAALALAGGAVLACAGYLGGHLAYALGVGIDTNAFQTGPRQWRVVAAETDVADGHPYAVSADGVSLLIIKQAGAFHVLGNRCTHRGAPLSDGSVDSGCITCPWHGSVFDLESGAVRRGPATQPQPVYETRVVEGNIQVLRFEPRALRANSVGAE